MSSAPFNSTCESAETGVSLAPLTVDADGAAQLSGISPSHLFALRRTGRFGPSPIRLGRCRRYLVKEIEAWLAAGAPSRAKWLALKGAKT